MKDKFWMKERHAKKTGCRVCVKLNAIGWMVNCCFVGSKINCR